MFDNLPCPCGADRRSLVMEVTAHHQEADTAVVRREQRLGGAFTFAPRYLAMRMSADADRPATE